MSRTSRRSIPSCSSDEQRVRDLFHDQKLADAVLARVLRPELEDVALKNRMTTAKLVWQPRSHDPHLQKWLHRIDVPTLLIWGEQRSAVPARSMPSPISG